MRIVVVGSSNTDMIIKSPRIPKPGETILGGEFQTAAGGKGANQAIAAARAGGDVAFVARIGDDMFGRRALEGFKNEGINCEYIKFDETDPSGVALIIVDDMGENSIAVASGANANLNEKDIFAVEHLIQKADILLMQLETPLSTIQYAAKIAFNANVTVLLNPAPAKQLPFDLLKHVSILTPNEFEVESLTGIKVIDDVSAKSASITLSSMGPKVIAITLGSAGVYLHHKDFSGIIPGFKMKAIDTTAAGDVFNGVLAAVLLENSDIFKAVKFAQAAAAISVTRLGAQPSAPSKEEIDKFIRSKQ
jgi:ribokinase